ncbi:MAG: hypothetical protein ABIT01_08290 [Thermoanaerobaculia bacterium]
MKRSPASFWTGLLAIGAGLLGSVPAQAAADAADLRTVVLARDAVSRDAVKARRARIELRALGADGLDVLFHTFSEELRLGSALAASGGRMPASWAPLTQALDEVAAQKDAYSARLFWFTDLAAAQREAKRTGKPILSLRLLGRLDEELSCANSRFFRTALYANRELSEILRRNWILHWESVRPVPVITVDFGDGRTMHRTVTGNSAHLVLTADGTLVDAIPGLYGPGAFLRVLQTAEGAAREASRIGESREFLRDYHRARLADSLRFRPEDSTIDEQSRSMMRAKSRGAFAAGSFVRVVSNFERSMAEDSARNEETMHLKIHEWLARESGTPIRTFTARMYDELFLTPGSDPWLGLAPDAYSAIQGEGLTSTPATGPASFRAPMPSAAAAGARTQSKMIVESPLLFALGMPVVTVPRR